MVEKKTFTKRKDFWIIAALLMIALAVWVVLTMLNWGKTGPYAEITYQGQLEKVLYLSEPQTYSLSENPQVQFEVKDNAISFVHSDCPDQVCVHTGWLSGAGQFAACLPNDVLLWVNSDEQGGPDITVK